MPTGYPKRLHKNLYGKVKAEVPTPSSPHETDVLSAFDARAAAEITTEIGFALIEDGTKLLYATRLLKRPLTELEMLRVDALINSLNAVKR